MARFLVIGNANIDLWKKNGDKRKSLGGKGWNIAKNLAVLGNEVTLLTFLGYDAEADFIMNEAVGYDIEIINQNTNPSLRTPLYTATLDPDSGEVITDEFISNIPSLITNIPEDEFDYVIIISFMPKESLDYIFKNRLNAKYCLSIAGRKTIPNTLDHLKELDFIALNFREASFYSEYPGIDIDEVDEPKLKEIASQVLEKGPKDLILTLGARGVIFNTNKDLIIREPKPLDNIISVLGAGDAFISGYLHKEKEGKDAAIDFAMKCASSVLKSHSACIETFEQLIE